MSLATQGLEKLYVRVNADPFGEVHLSESEHYAAEIILANPLTTLQELTLVCVSISAAELTEILGRCRTSLKSLEITGCRLISSSSATRDDNDASATIIADWLAILREIQNMTNLEMLKLEASEEPRYNVFDGCAALRYVAGGITGRES
jgi:hypothetical protein